MNGIKKAFTLAEVLITLTIIGIVAAVSIPTMVADHSEKETVARVKKFYTTMEQVYRLAVTEYGPISRWNVPDGMDSASATRFAEYIKPYLNSTISELFFMALSYNFSRVYFSIKSSGSKK